MPTISAPRHPTEPENMARMRWIGQLGIDFTRLMRFVPHRINLRPHCFSASYRVAGCGKDGEDAGVGISFTPLAFSWGRGHLGRI
jgi:hypothetical protein